MKLRLLVSTFAFLASFSSILLFPSSAVGQGSACTSTYGSTCPSCAGTRLSRTYVNVQPFGCTSCNTFCKINLPLSDVDASESAEEQHGGNGSGELSPSDERLLVRISRRLVSSLAPKSPDIAQAAKNLGELSERLDTPMPSQGNARFEKLFTPASVTASLAGKDISTITSLVKDIPGQGNFSFVTWELKKLQTGAVLLMTHQLMNSQNEQIGKTQPDIAFQLKWRRSGKAGYWEAHSWRAVTAD